MILKERKVGGEIRGNCASSFIQNSGAKLPRAPRISQLLITGTPRTNSDSMCGWGGRRSPGQLEQLGVYLLGLLSEQESEWALIEEVCVAFYRKFHFVVESSRAP